MAAHENTQPVYMIGVVASLTQMHAQTIRLYERLGRMDEYQGVVERLKRERSEELAKYPDLSQEIVRSVS